MLELKRKKKKKEEEEEKPREILEIIPRDRGRNLCVCSRAVFIQPERVSLSVGDAMFHAKHGSMPATNGSSKFNQPLTGVPTFG